jgi:glycosyl transferase, family 25
MQPCPLLVINLPSSTERRDAMAEQLARLRLEAVFIEAVDGRAMEAGQRAAHCAESFTAFHSPLTAAEIGCYLSHLKALEHIVHQDWPWAVVLEDDLVLPADVAQRLGVVCRETAGDYDLIKLLGHLRQHLVLQTFSNGDQLVRYRRPPISACAHLWSRTGAQKILAHSRRIRRPIDVEIKHWWEMDLHVATLVPELVRFHPVIGQASTIGARSLHSSDGCFRRLRYKLNYSVASRYHMCLDTGWAKGLRLLLPF